MIPFIISLCFFTRGCFVAGRWYSCVLPVNGPRTVRKGAGFLGGVIHRVCETGCPPRRCGVSAVVLQASHTIGIKWPKNSWATMLRGRIGVSPMGMQRNALQHAQPREKPRQNRHRTPRATNACSHTISIEPNSRHQKEHDATCGCSISCKLLQSNACQGIVYPFAHRNCGDRDDNNGRVSTPRTYSR